MASGRMIALLGLLAVAGYQNRDKLGEMLGRVTGQSNDNNPVGRDDATPGEANTGGIGGFLGDLFGGNGGDADRTTQQGGSGFMSNLQNMFGGSAGTGIGGGLRDLVDQFTGRGHGEEAKSWVETGPNRGMSNPSLAEALGEDTLETLTTQTGLSRDELLARLGAVLPSAVDTLTPDGRVPNEGEPVRPVLVHGARA